MEYTVEVYKSDRRLKTGERLVEKRDVDSIDEAMAVPCRRGYRLAIHRTWVTRTNFMSGKEFKERYDTPHYCSPSSESYWSM